jgi:hypothetical protein
MSLSPAPPLGAGRSGFPGIVISFILGCLAILTWPWVLRNFCSLWWEVGNVAPAALALSLLLTLAALITWMGRRRIGSSFARAFPTPREALFAATSLVLTTLLFAILAEVGLRLFQIPFRLGWTPMEYRISRFDPVLGWSYVPDLSTVERFGSMGRPVAIFTDASGHRVASAGAQPDPSTPTALFVGCSYTFGHGLPFEETFPGQIASLPGFPLQVVNLGVQGYGTDQSLLSLKQVLTKFNTKVVIYTFLLDHVKRNDNDDRRFIFPKARFPGTKPRFAVAPDGSLRQVSLPRPYDQVLDCHLCDLVRLFWTRWGPEPSVELTRALVNEMKDYVVSNGATFVLVLWTNPHPPAGQELGQVLFPGLNTNVVDVGAGAPAEFPQWMIPGETHPDARAHAFVARRIAAKLQELGLSRP